jgi:hypothetical protein
MEPIVATRPAPALPGWTEFADHIGEGHPSTHVNDAVDDMHHAIPLEGRPCELSPKGCSHCGHLLADPACSASTGASGATCRAKLFAEQLGAAKSLSVVLTGFAGLALSVALWRLRVVFRIGIVFRYAADHAAANQWLEVRLQGICFLFGIHF